MASERQPTETVRVACDVADGLRFVSACGLGANHRPLKQTDLLDAILRPIVAAMKEEARNIVKQDPDGKLTIPELLDVMAKRVCHDHAARPKKKA